MFGDFLDSICRFFKIFYLIFIKFFIVVFYPQRLATLILSVENGLSNLKQCPLSASHASKTNCH
jgi:hypothetical protein